MRQGSVGGVAVGVGRKRLDCFPAELHFAILSHRQSDTFECILRSLPEQNGFVVAPLDYLYFQELVHAFLYLPPYLPIFVECSVQVSKLSMG